MTITKIAFISYILLMLGCGGDSSGTTGSLTIVNGTIISQDTQANITVKIEDNVIYYTGDISEHSYQIFERAISNADVASLEKMVINSGGGSTVAGRKLGKFVFDNKLDVQVDVICFSSCANYIFTAGKNKTISKGAFVGWHGNEHQSFVVAKIENKSVKEVQESFLRGAFKALGLSEKEKEEAIQQQKPITKKSMQDEKEFYEYIKVNLHIALLGMPQQLKENKSGFSYSIEDMKKFNVYDVEYLGDGYYRDNLPKDIALHKVTQDVNALEAFDYGLLD